MDFEDATRLVRFGYRFVANYITFIVDVLLPIIIRVFARISGEISAVGVENGLKMLILPF